MYPTLPFWTAMLATEIFNNNICYNCVSRKELEVGLTFLKTCLKLWQCHHKRQLLRINPSPSMWHYLMSGKTNYQAHFARRTLWYFSAFFNHSALEYTIPLTSKLILLCVTLANLSHFDSNWILLLNCRILTLLYRALSTFFESFLLLFSLLLFSLFCPLSST